MIYLNAGNLWDNVYLDTVIEWNKEFRDSIQVKCIFGSVARLTPTARAFDRLPERDWDFTTQYVKKAQENGIKIRYTLNQSCIGSIQGFRQEWHSGLKEAVKKLHDIGVNEWTITSPLLVELLRDMYPDDFIEVSTIAEVATPEDAMRWWKLGANGVNISTSVNRDFTAMTLVANTGMKASILANEACLFRCPWRRECYNLSSHNSDRAEDLFGFYPFRRCTEVRLANPVEWLMSRLVLPQWMKVYQDLTGVNWFKIAYRTHPRELALPMLRSYMEQEFHGNLLELWPTITHLGKTDEPKDKHSISVDQLKRTGFLGHFVERGDKCSHTTCNDCGYCHRTYRIVTGNS